MNSARSSLDCVPLRGALVDEVVEPLALDRGQHLERDDQHDVAVAAAATAGWAARCPLGLVRRGRELFREAAFGHPTTSSEPAGDRGGEHEEPPCRRAARAAAGPARPPATKPSANPAIDPGVQRLQHADVEEHPGLPDDNMNPIGTTIGTSTRSPTDTHRSRWPAARRRPQRGRRRATTSTRIATRTSDRRRKAVAGRSSRRPRRPPPRCR